MDPVAEQLHLERRERIRRGPSRRENLVSLASAVLLVGACVTLALIGVPTHPDPIAACLLILLYACFWQVEFEVGAITAAPLQVLIVPMWFVIDPALLPLAVGLGQALGNLLADARSPSRIRWGRTLLGVSDAWHAVGPALVLSVMPMAGTAGEALRVAAIALLSQFAFDWAGTRARAWAIRCSPTPFASYRWMWTVDAALAPIGFFAAVAEAASPFFLLGLLPVALIFAQFARERDERIMKAVELSSAYKGTAQLMGDVLEADDAYTGGEHTRGVVGLALDLGRAIGLDARSMRDLEFGALLHDIGKLRVPNEIINKPGKLNDEEWAIIKEHPGYGQEMLDRVGGELSRAGLIVRAHHERWDGNGYPDGLKGEEIPVEARIITICDSFSAMTTDRSYRKGMSHAEAVAELDRCSGSQFDPTLVETTRQILGVETPTLAVVELSTAVSGPAAASQPSATAAQATGTTEQAA